MKEYNILINKQPEGEIIVYMLTYYDNFSVRNGLLIDANACEKATKKLSINSQLGLIAVLSSMNWRHFELVENGIGITASSYFLVEKYIGDIEPDIINIEIPEIGVVPAKVLYGTENGIGISESLSELKLGLEKFSNKLHVVQADISEMIKSSSEQCDGHIILTPVIDDLLYRDAHFNGASAIEFTASVSAMLKRYRLFSDMDGHTLADFDDMTLEDVDYVLLTDG